MAILLDVQQLTASFGARPLFQGINFTVDEKERIGLIGPNGAGKSTLLRILAETASADDGTIARRRGLRVALLEQTPRFADGVTVQDALLEGIGAGADDHEAHEQLRRVLATLALESGGAGPDTPVASLSGGWKKRVAIGRALARRRRARPERRSRRCRAAGRSASRSAAPSPASPDLLLLDEPTNHLDVDGIEWLEALLSGRGAAFATITVTHDRLFLQRVTTRILELDRRNAGGLLSVAGDYATYVRVKAETMHAQERREVVLRNTLRRETEWLRRGPAARTTKQQARIERAGTLGDEVAELGRRNQTRTATLEFGAAEARPRRLIEARGIAKSYDGRTIFEGIDLRLGPGVRVGLLGPNGCGKSTLIRVLLGEEAPATGTVTRADGLQVAYFQQSREALDPTLSLTDTLCPDGDHVSFRGARVHVRGYLERFLFTPEQMPMAVGKLSGGEQSRLLLAQLMLREAQLLVLDEPTNDLDLPTLAVLEESLTGFDGAVLLVTHDRYFLDQVATTILAFDTRPGAPRGVIPFASLGQWEAWRAETVAAEKSAAAAGAADQPARPRPDRERAESSATRSSANTTRSRRRSPAPRPRCATRAPTASAPSTRATPPSWSRCSRPSTSARPRSIACTRAGPSWRRSSPRAAPEHRLALTDGPPAPPFMVNPDMATKAELFRYRQERMGPKARPPRRRGAAARYACEHGVAGRQRDRQEGGQERHRHAERLQVGREEGSLPAREFEDGAVAQVHAPRRQQAAAGQLAVGETAAGHDVAVGARSPRPQLASRAARAYGCPEKESLRTTSRRPRVAKRCSRKLSRNQDGTRVAVHARAATVVSPRRLRPERLATARGAGRCAAAQGSCAPRARSRPSCPSTAARADWCRRSTITLGSPGTRTRALQTLSTPPFGPLTSARRTSTSSTDWANFRTFASILRLM